MLRKIASAFIVFSFFLSTLGPIPQATAAGNDLGLPLVGSMVNLSPAFEPALIKGLTVHKDNPFLFDFIMDTGHSKLEGLALKNEGDRLIKYFFACLTIPEKDLWVNLSPYEKDRMIPAPLGQTALGRDLLAQDYILKQLTASLIYPEKGLGKDFWDRIYAKSRQMFGNAQVPVNTFNKVWILADKATVYEHNQTAFVVDGHLKVMLEEDYVALNKATTTGGHVPAAPQGNNQTQNIGSQIIREIILPEIEKEVNTGKNFAMLRQIINSLILATWYKKNLKEVLLNQVYMDKSTVNGVNLSDASAKEKIYQQYLQAYKKGVFNYIKEETDSTTKQTIPHKYFSGGVSSDLGRHLVVEDGSSAMIEPTLRRASTPTDKFFDLAAIVHVNAPIPSLPTAVSVSEIVLSESDVKKMAKKQTPVGGALVQSVTALKAVRFLRQKANQNEIVKWEPKVENEGAQTMIPLVQRNFLRLDRRSDIEPILVAMVADAAKDLKVVSVNSESYPTEQEAKQQAGNLRNLGLRYTWRFNTTAGLARLGSDFKRWLDNKEKEILIASNSAMTVQWQKGATEPVTVRTVSGKEVQAEVVVAHTTATVAKPVAPDQLVDKEGAPTENVEISKVVITYDGNHGVELPLQTRKNDIQFEVFGPIVMVSADGQLQFFSLIDRGNQISLGPEVFIRNGAVAPDRQNDLNAHMPNGILTGVKSYSIDPKTQQLTIEFIDGTSPIIVDSFRLYSTVASNFENVWQGAKAEEIYVPIKALNGQEGQAEIRTSRTTGPRKGELPGEEIVTLKVSISRDGSLPEDLPLQTKKGSVEFQVFGPVVMVFTEKLMQFISFKDIKNRSPLALEAFVENGAIAVNQADELRRHMVNDPQMDGFLLTGVEGYAIDPVTQELTIELTGGTKIPIDPFRLFTTLHATGQNSAMSTADIRVRLFPLLEQVRNKNIARYPNDTYLKWPSQQLEVLLSTNPKKDVEHGWLPDVRVAIKQLGLSDLEIQQAKGILATEEAGWREASLGAQSPASESKAMTATQYLHKAEGFQLPSIFRDGIITTVLDDYPDDEASPVFKHLLTVGTAIKAGINPPVNSVASLMGIWKERFSINQLLQSLDDTGLEFSSNRDNPVFSWEAILFLIETKQNDSVKIFLDTYQRVLSRLPAAIMEPFKNELRKKLEAKDLNIGEFLDRAAVVNFQEEREGGIDLKAIGAGLSVQKDKNGGVQVTFDPAMVERIRKDGVKSVVPFIINVTPMTASDIRPLLGLNTSREDEETEKLAGV